MAVVTHTVSFDAACTGCGACLLSCPTHAIRPVPGAPGTPAVLVALADLCTGCGECVEVCPADAIDVQPRRCP